MSSLWTPGGEVPVDRGRTRSPSPDAAPTAEPRDDAAMAAELQRYLLEAPAEEVVAQHAVGLYELAALHLSQPEPRLAEARLAIDALRALVDGLEGRLGEAGRQLRDLLPQLQMAFVQLADRDREQPSDTDPAPPSG